MVFQQQGLANGPELLRSSAHPPLANSCNHTSSQTKSADLPPAISRRKHQNISAHTLSAYVSPRAARQTAVCLAATPKCKPNKIIRHKTNFVCTLLVKEKRTRTRAIYEGFCSQTPSASTQAFTARVLTRPQHGMRPTRRLRGPFFFVSQPSDTLPAEVETYPLSNRGTRTEAFGISNRVRLDVLCFLKEMREKKESLTVKSSEVSCLFPNNPACSCCEIKDWIIA